MFLNQDFRLHITLKRHFLKFRYVFKFNPYVNAMRQET